MAGLAHKSQASWADKMVLKGLLEAQCIRHSCGSHTNADANGDTGIKKYVLVHLMRKLCLLCDLRCKACPE